MMSLTRKESSRKYLAARSDLFFQLSASSFLNPCGKAHLRQSWPFHGGELLRLVKMLVDWKAAGAMGGQEAREVNSISKAWSDYGHTWRTVRMGHLRPITGRARLRTNGNDYI